MNVIALIGQAYPQMGGAQLTVRTLLEKLHAEYGFACELLTPYPRKHKHTQAGVTLSTYRDEDELKALVRARRPHVLLASVEPLPVGLGIAARFNIPTIAYFQSYEFCQPTLAQKRLWGLDLKRQYPSPEQVAYTLRTADVLLANSKHVQNCFTQKQGIAPRVLYPEIILKPFRPRRNPQYITGICGSAYKGIEIFLALADAFPDEKFLLVGDVQPAWMAQVRARSNILLRGRDEPEHFLRDSKIVLVPSQWQEPFGRIAVEAMGYGIPTLVSYTGGLQEIVADAPMSIRHFRSPEAWRRHLEVLLASAQLRTEYGQLGRTLVSKFLGGESTRQLAGLMQDLAAKRVPNYDAPPLVRFRGAAEHKTAFSMVNAAWQQGLGQAVQMDNGQVGDLFRAPDIVIDHDYEQDFGRAIPPPSGKWVVVRTWDFGPFPTAWVAKLNAECDQLWVHSHWVRQQAIAGGMDPRRVRVVPHGIDPHIFTPQGPRYPLPTRKRFKFIFVGAPVFRKGIDILLRAYRQAFTADDDVCLVIKAHGQDVFYNGISYHDEIVQAQRDPQAPSIVYLNQYLSPAELGSLYRACDAAVFPYRAEGFGIPILEAMACGVPPLVPRFGACLDFCNTQNAFLMPVRRIAVPVHSKFAFNTLGFQEEVERVDFGEVSVEALVTFLRQTYTMSASALQAKGARGAAQAHTRFTWENSVTHILHHLTALERYATPYRLHRTRQDAAQRLQKLETARRLYEQSMGERRF